MGDDGEGGRKTELEFVFRGQTQKSKDGLNCNSKEGRKGSGRERYSTGC